MMMKTFNNSLLIILLNLFVLNITCAQNISVAEGIGIPGSTPLTKLVFNTLEKNNVILSKTTFIKKSLNENFEMTMLVWPKEDTIEIIIKKSEVGKIHYIYSYQFGLLISGEKLPFKSGVDEKKFTRLVTNQKITYPEILLSFLGGQLISKDSIPEMLFHLPQNIYGLLINDVSKKDISIPSTFSTIDKGIFFEKIKDIMLFVCDGSIQGKEKEFDLGIGNLTVKTDKTLIEQFDFKSGNYSLSVNTNFVKNKGSKDYIEPTYVEEYDIDAHIGEDPSFGFIIKKDMNVVVMDINSRWSKYLYSGNKNIPNSNMQVKALNNKPINNYTSFEIENLLKENDSVLVEFAENNKAVLFKKIDLRDRMLIDRASRFLKSESFWEKSIYEN